MLCRLLSRHLSLKSFLYSCLHTTFPVLALKITSAVDPSAWLWQWCPLRSHNIFVSFFLLNYHSSDEDSRNFYDMTRYSHRWWYLFLRHHRWRRSLAHFGWLAPWFCCNCCVLGSASRFCGHLSVWSIYSRCLAEGDALITCDQGDMTAEFSVGSRRPGIKIGDGANCGLFPFKSVFGWIDRGAGLLDGFIQSQEKKHGYLWKSGEYTKSRFSEVDIIPHY